MTKFQRKYSLLLFAVLYFFVYLVWNKLIVGRPYQSGPVQHFIITRHSSAQLLSPEGNEQSDINVIEEVPTPTKEREEEVYPSPVTSSKEYDGFKKILFWNDAYGDPGFFFGQGHEPFVRASCPVSSCFATHNRSLYPLEDVDAVLWHLRSKDKSLPRKRSPHTYFIFWMIESALYTYQDVSFYNGIFNWTFTYRTDSDFPRPYGKIVRTPVGPGEAAALGRTNYADGKTKLAVWFVSNCNTVSEREILVRTLQRTITVDVYGACGQYTCPKSHHAFCQQMMEREYKFYFSFENSLCYDYVTEKLFSVLRRNIVPVVYGLGYDHLDLPPHSYIDVFDFESVQHLANYLLYLDRNDTAYNEYFRWKSEGYRIDSGSQLDQQLFCDLCERLHQVAPPNAGGHPRGNQVEQNLDVVLENRQGNIRLQSDALGRKSQTTSLREGETHRQKSLDAERNLEKEGKARAAGQHYNYQAIAPEHRKVYKNLHEWFVLDKCMDPFSDRVLSAFIHGDNVVESAYEGRALKEEALLPYRIRPRKDLWN